MILCEQKFKGPAWYYPTEGCKKEKGHKERHRIAVDSNAWLGATPLDRKELRYTITVEWD